MKPVDHQIADSVWTYVHNEVHYQVRFNVRHQLNVQIWDRVRPPFHHQNGFEIER